MAVKQGLVPTQRMYTVAISQGCGAKVARARRLIDQMIELGVQPNTANYSAAINVYARANRHVDAKRLLFEMRECGVATNEV